MIASFLLAALLAAPLATSSSNHAQVSHPSSASSAVPVRQAVPAGDTISLIVTEGYVTEIVIGGIGIASVTPTPVDVFMAKVFGTVTPQTLTTKWIDTKGLEQIVTTPCINFLTARDCSDSHDKAVDAHLAKHPLPPPPKMDEIKK